MSNIRNSVGKGVSIKNTTKVFLPTTSDKVYRVTGMDQIQDIISCGYVRPKPNRKEIIYWSQGGDDFFYIDKRPVIEAPISKVYNGLEGEVPLEYITGIWMYSEEQDRYINGIEYVIDAYNELHSERTR